MQFLSLERMAAQVNQWFPLESSMKQQVQIMDLWGDLLLYMLPIWLSIVIGLVLGWTWKPRWVSLCIMALRSKPRLALTFPPGLGARRLWLAATAAAAAPAVRAIWERLWAWAQKQEMLQTFLRVPRSKQGTWAVVEAPSRRPSGSNKTLVDPQPSADDRRVAAVNLPAEGPRVVTRVPELIDPSGNMEDVRAVVNVTDLEDLCARLDERDGGPSWDLLMEKSCPGMKYRVWRRDPEVGPTQYRSQTILEACSPETMRDFFWDDEFRISSRWDEMLVASSVVEEWQETGVQIVQWLRKFPFFCKDREYVIGRRIWSLGGAYFCITKGITHPVVPEKVKPRRVGSFYSSWRIRGVEDGACEVLLFHAEDMGIQKDLAKMGIRQGMWSAVKKIEPGVRRYQKLREGGSPFSRSASMANIHTPISPTGPPELTRVWRSVSENFLRGSGSGSDGSDGEGEEGEQGSGGGDGLKQRGEGGGGSRQEGVGMGRQGGPGGGGQEDGSLQGGGRAVGRKREGGGEKGKGKGKGRGRGKLGLFVAGGIMAVACGVQTSLLLKVLLAGAVQNQVQKKLRGRK